MRKQVQCRLVKVYPEGGATETLCTSLLDKVQYPACEFKDLYHLRWNEEEAYRHFKALIGIEALLYNNTMYLLPLKENAAKCTSAQECDATAASTKLKCRVPKNIMAVLSFKEFAALKLWRCIISCAVMLLYCIVSILLQENL